MSFNKRKKENKNSSVFIKEEESFPFVLKICTSFHSRKTTMATWRRETVFFFFKYLLISVVMMITASVGARNFATVAVPKSATWRSWRRKDPVSTKMAVSSNQQLISLEVSGSGAARQSCVAIKKGLADEEDYIKAGGSQLLFVQMQQHKEMDEQSKLADKVFISFSLTHFICTLFFKFFWLPLINFITVPMKMKLSQFS